MVYTEKKFLIKLFLLIRLKLYKVLPLIWLNGKKKKRENFMAIKKKFSYESLKKRRNDYEATLYKKLT